MRNSLSAFMFAPTLFAHQKSKKQQPTTIIIAFLTAFQITVVSGVVLVSWRQAVLQKQIDYGAKLGHVVLSLAKMELENFFKNVMPVADYFDQSDLLLAVSAAFVLHQSLL